MTDTTTSPKASRAEREGWTFDTAQGEQRWHLPRYSTAQVIAVCRRSLVVDYVDVCRSFGLSKSRALELRRADQFPVPLLNMGSRYEARAADLLAALGLPVSLIVDQPAPAADAAVA